MVSWSKLWDLALDGGPKCVRSTRAFVRIISYPSYSNCLPYNYYVILTVWIRPYLLTNFIPIWMLLMVFQTSLIHCRLLPASISDSDSNTDQVLSTTLMDSSSNSDISLTDFSQFFNMIYPLSTLFTCWS